MREQLELKELYDLAYGVEVILKDNLEYRQ